MTTSHSECSAGKLVDQEQFLYRPVLKCVYLHLANKCLPKKKGGGAEIGHCSKWLRDQKTVVQILGGEQIFVVSTRLTVPHRPFQLCVHVVLGVNGYGWSSKACLSSAKMNVWTCTSTSTIWHNGVALN
jgi:hypothetical protein